MCHTQEASKTTVLGKGAAPMSRKSRLARAHASSTFWIHRTSESLRAHESAGLLIG
jgi:hypothetical protein